MSVKVTVEVPTGPEDAGGRAGSPSLYDRPVRCGAGVGITVIGVADGLGC